MNESEILKFLHWVEELKKVKRTGWLNRGISNPESVADHTFAVAIITSFYSDLLGLDSGKAIKMALLHDLQESITGDITPDTLDIDEKREKEENAIKKILIDMPNDYLSLWQEYAEGKTKEAKLVAQIDKLEMLLQANIYKKAGFDVSDFWDHDYEFEEPLLKLIKEMKKEVTT
jgi:putative hydrolase of HD superfamily